MPPHLPSRGDIMAARRVYVQLALRTILCPGLLPTTKVTASPVVGDGWAPPSLPNSPGACDQTALPFFPYTAQPSAEDGRKAFHDEHDWRGGV